MKRIISSQVDARLAQDRLVYKTSASGSPNSCNHPECTQGSVTNGPDGCSGRPHRCPHHHHEWLVSRAT
jgi:hypothetical protein